MEKDAASGPPAQRWADLEVYFYPEQAVVAICVIGRRNYEALHDQLSDDGLPCSLAIRSDEIGVIKNSASQTLLVNASNPVALTLLATSITTYIRRNRPKKVNIDGNGVTSAEGMSAREIERLLKKRAGRPSEDVATPDVLINPSQEPPKPEEATLPAENIFISHSSSDRTLADLFKNTLVLGGISANSIFYSSARSTGIPVGEDFRRHLRTRLRSSGLIVQLVSPSFLQSHWCLYEVGAAWALDSATFPMIVPPLDYEAVVSHFGDTHSALLGPDDVSINEIFSELSDQIQSRFSSTLKVSQWNEAVQFFREGIPAALLASATEAASSIGDDFRTGAAAIDRPGEIGPTTLQEQISPFLSRIARNHNIPYIYIQLSNLDAWLGIASSSIRQFGMDHNSIGIYYSDPTVGERVSLDTFVNWYEGYTLEQVLLFVRRVFQDDSARRELAQFDITKAIDDFRAQLHQISGL